MRTFAGCAGFAAQVFDAGSLQVCSRLGAADVCFSRPAWRSPLQRLVAGAAKRICRSPGLPAVIPLANACCTQGIVVACPTECSSLIGLSQSREFAGSALICTWHIEPGCVMKFVVTSAAAKLPCTPTPQGPKDTSPTFRVAAAEWQAAQTKWGATNRRLVWTLLEGTVFPQIGDMQMVRPADAQ